MEHFVEQRSEEWFALREPCITASQFNDVLVGTPKAWTRIIEEKKGIRKGFQGNEATRWGNKYEDEALALFSFQEQLQVEKSGFFIYDKNPGIGASPDGKIGSDTLAEVKCPFNPDVHLKTWREQKVPAKYIPQIQGQLEITDRNFCWFISYDPRQEIDLQIVKILVARDQNYIDSLLIRLENFLFCWKNDEDPLNYFASPKGVDLDELPDLF